MDQIDGALAKIAAITGKTFGSNDNPLLCRCVPAHAFPCPA
jgi:hypothetical protein